MTVWELIQQLTECEPDAIVHFKVDLDEEVITNLAEEHSCLYKEPFSLTEIDYDDTDVDINLIY